MVALKRPAARHGLAEPGLRLGCPGCGVRQTQGLDAVLRNLTRPGCCPRSSRSCTVGTHPGAPEIPIRPRGRYTEFAGSPRHMGTPSRPSRFITHIAHSMQGSSRRHVVTGLIIGHHTGYPADRVNQGSVQVGLHLLVL